MRFARVIEAGLVVHRWAIVGIRPCDWRKENGMAEDLPENFSGYLLRDRQCVSIEDAYPYKLAD